MFPRNHRGSGDAETEAAQTGRESTLDGTCNLARVGRGMASTSPGSQRWHPVEHEQPLRCGGTTRMRRAATMIRHAAGSRHCGKRRVGRKCWAGRAWAFGLGVWNLVKEAQQRCGRGYHHGEDWKMPICLGKIRGPVVVYRPHLVIGF